MADSKHSAVIIIGSFEKANKIDEQSPIKRLLVDYRFSLFINTHIESALSASDNQI